MEQQRSAFETQSRESSPWTLRVIPLGSKMFVPGYGEGVAADTGSAVRGAIIDVWFPTVEQALLSGVDEP